MENLDYKKILGCKIKAIRNSLQLTQESFCNEINLEIPNLSNIENGKNFPSVQTILNILNKFNIEPNELFDTRFSEEPKIIEKLIDTYISKLSFKKKIMALKIIMLINEEDKSKK